MNLNSIIKSISSNINRYMIINIMKVVIYIECNSTKTDAILKKDEGKNLKDLYIVYLQTYRAVHTSNKWYT